MEKYVFIGASIRGRTAEEGEGIADRVGKIARILDELGYGYDSAVIANKDIYRGSGEQPEIPEEFFKVSKAYLNSIRGLRAYPSDLKKIKTDIAMHRWAMSLIKKSVGCIWEGSRSYAGMGFEIAEALHMDRHCLVLYDRPPHQTISSVIAGSLSRLLVVRQFKQETYREEIREFTRKIEGGLDKVIRFNASVEMEMRIEKALRKYEFMDRSEYIRYLIQKDLEELDAE